MKHLDSYTKVILTVIAACLVILVARSGPWPPVVHADDMGKLNYTKDAGVGVATSADGKYVFVVGTEGIVRSEDFGRIGSWEKVVKED